VRKYSRMGPNRGDFIPITDGDVHLLIYMSILIDLLIFFREFQWGSHPFWLLR
jgi:hypothetical protein